MMYTRTRRGVSAVEVLVGVSIAGIMLVAAGYTISMFVNASQKVSEKTQALYLAEEGLELVRFVRDENWASISGLDTGDTHYLSIGASVIAMSGTPETIGIFSRSITFENAYRNNTTNDIVASGSGGSSEDVNTKYVTATVTWGNPPESVSLTTILANPNP